MRSLGVVIPSRTQDSQLRFLERCIASIRGQSRIAEFSLRIIVGVDPGASPGLAQSARRLGFELAEAGAESQAGALNAALHALQTDWVAFLEDDDLWHPQYLQNASAAMAAGAQFVSSTQLEVDERGVVIRINDFPTPSGWLMSRELAARVGPFDAAYRFHLDNEWLGRLAETAAPRMHMVESTAPVDPHHIAQVRPWLMNALTLSGGHCRLGRHALPVPLVQRLVHSSSGMARIAADPELAEVSRAESERLLARFGRIPW
jgi:glycosyltransferase involved in cell wall biosynthesis